MRKLVLVAMLAGAVAAAADAPFAAGQAGAGAGLRARLADRLHSPPAPGAVEHAYGADPLQRLDLWRPAPANRPAALIVFVHGGGWSRGDKANATGAAKVAHFLAQGYAVASLNYRLVPAARVEQQAADVATALAWLRAHAAQQGIDPGRIVLMGHSAGAHLVALVGTDPRYLAAAGVSFAAIRGVIALDGAGYDVPRQISDGGPMLRGTYRHAFGDEPARQRSLSPTLQAAAPNAPAFLLAHVDRPDSAAQSEALGAALRQAGADVQVAAFAGQGLQGHMAINRSLGEPAYPATAVVDAWLGRVAPNTRHRPHTAP